VVKHSGFHRARANDIDPNARAGEFEGSGLRDTFHGMLAADIRGRTRATDFPIRRRDVNDAAFALPKHCPNLILHAQKHTKHIRIEDGSVVLGVGICDGLGIADGAGVIDGNVQAAETGNDLVDEVFNFLFIPHVGAQKFGLSSEGAQFSGQLLPLTFMSTRNNNPGSFTRERNRRGTTDARQRSGN
jgi:hypothetical protein